MSDAGTERWVVCEKEQQGRLPARIYIVDGNQAEEVRDNLGPKNRLLFLVTYEKFMSFLADIAKEGD